MSSRWNPSAPETVGLEILPNSSSVFTLGATPGIACIIDAKSTELVRGVVPHLGGASGHQSGTTWVQADVYDASDLANNPPQTAATALTYMSSPPVKDVFNEGPAFFANNDGTRTGFYARVNEPDTLVSPTDTDYFDYVNPAGFGLYGIGWQSGATWRDYTTGIVTPITGKRIAVVQVIAYVQNLSTQYAGRLYGFLSNLLPGTYSPGYHTLPARMPVTRLNWSYALNPFTGLPFTLEDLAQFQPGGPACFGLTFQAGPTSSPIRVYSVSLEVAWVPETRIASGVVPITAVDSAAAWRPIALSDPAARSRPIAWPKQAGKKYWVVFSAPGGPGATAVGPPAQLSYLSIGGTDTTTPTDILNASAYTPLAQAGILDFNATPWPPVSGPAQPSVVFDTGGGAYSAEGQPYAAVGVSLVDSTQHVLQEFSTLDPSTDYGLVGVSLTGAGIGQGLGPTASLDIVIIDRTAGDSYILGPVSIQPTELLAGSAPQFLRIEFPVAFTPVAGHQYAVRLSSLTDPVVPWIIWQAGSAETGPMYPVSAVNFGGSNDAATPGTGIRDPSLDLVITLASVPSSPAPVAATPFSLALVGSSAGGGCAIPYIGATQLVWAPSTLTLGQFGLYEVQRNDDARGWQTIATLPARDTPSFFDFEARRNTVASYRVRTIRADGAFSNWSPVATATAPAAAADFLLVSNQLPSYAIGCTHDPTQPFEFQDAADVVKHKLFGRNYHVSYHPLEYRGDKFKRTIVLAVNAPAGMRGRAVFDPLVTLCTANLPYVVVLSGDGDRWYASVETATGTRVEPGGRYHADIEITEVTDTPAAALASFVPSAPGTLLYGDPGGVYGDSGGTYGTV